MNDYGQPGYTTTYALIIYTILLILFECSIYQILRFIETMNRSYLTQSQNT